MAFETKGSSRIKKGLSDIFSAIGDSYGGDNFGFRKDQQEQVNPQEERIKAYLAANRPQEDQQQLSVDPYEGLFSGQSGATRPFSFELPTQGLVDPRYAPDTSNMPSPSRKIQTQGSSIPESIFRSPSGSKNMPTPEVATQTETDMTPEEKAAYEKENPGFFKKGLGNLEKAAPQLGQQIMGLLDQGNVPDRDYTTLGIMMKRAGLINKFSDMNLPNPKEEYKQGLFKDAFRNSVNERGDFDESKLVKNLSQAGFGQEAYNLWSKRMSESKRLGLELMKMDAKKKEPGVQLTNEAYADLQKRFPNAKIEIDANGAVKKITTDPMAVERARQGQVAKDIQAQNTYYQTGTQVNTGRPQIGGGGGVPSASRGQIQQLPQVGGPSRGPSALGPSGVPLEALPQGGMGASEAGPQINFQGSPKAIADQKLAERKRAQKSLDSAGGNDVRGIQDSLDNLNGIEDLVANVKINKSGTDTYLDPKVKTGRALKYLPDVLQNKELQTTISVLNRNLFQEKARMVKGMSRIADSEKESAMFEKGMPLVENSNQTNQNIVKTMKAQFNNYLDYVSEKQSYINQYGTDQGFDDRWRVYKQNNPRVIRGKNGLMSDSGMVVPYNEYKDQSSQGAKPIPFNIDGMKENFVDPRIKSPLLQDTGLPNKLKDDQMYIWKGGSISGKGIKDFIKKHGGS